MAALCLAELVCSLEGNMLAVALGELYRIYGDPIQVGWLLTAFTLTAASSAAISGRLGDLYGRRRVLLVLLMLAGLGSVISATFADLHVITFGRVLQGASMGILPLCFGLLKEHATADRIPNLLGILGGVYSFGVAAGLVIGGLIIDYGHWQQLFIVSAGNAFIAFVLVLLILPRGVQQIRPGVRIDWLGGILFAPAIASMLFGLDQGKRLGFAAPAPWLWFAATVTLMAVWTWHELRCENPLIDVRQLKKPAIAAANGCVLLISGGPMLYALVVLPMILQPKWTGVGLGLAATVAAVVKIPANIASGAAAVFAGRLAALIGPRQVVLAACLATAAGSAFLILSHSSAWVIAGVMIFLLASPLSLILATLPMFILQATPADRASEASGLFQVCRSLGQAIGIQAIAMLLATASVQISGGGSRFPAESAYVLALCYFVSMGLCGALCILPAPRARILAEPHDGAPAESTAPTHA